MLLEGPRCPNCANGVELRAFFSAVGTDELGLIRQRVGIVCATCGSKLRVAQPRLLPFKLAVLVIDVVSVAIVGAAEKSAGIAFLGIAGLTGAMLSAAFFVALTRWYTPHFADLYVVPANHALYLPLESHARE